MKNDLRVVKTLRRIKEVFLELLDQKPLDKITVTEISRIAEINKGTFYLHYRDIYDLFDEILKERLSGLTDHIDFYQEFFDNPSGFADKCFSVTDGKIPAFDDPVFYKHNSRYLSAIPEIMSEGFREKIYALGRISRCHENDIKMDYIFSSLFFFLKSELLENEKIIAAELLASSIRSAFPDQTAKI